MIKRVLTAIVAVLLLIAGGALAAAAGWVHTAFDESGTMRFDAGTITPGPDARSTVIDVATFGATVPYIGEFGSTRLSVTTGERGDPSDVLFIGAASTDDVDAFVKGSPYAVALRIGSEWITKEVPGALIPPLPRDQPFWLAQEVGPNPGLVVPSDRPLTLLIMHPAGIPSGPLTLSIDFTIPLAARWSLGLAIAAGVLLIVGVVLLIVVARMRGRRGRHEFDADVPLPAATVEIAEPEIAEPEIAEPEIDADVTDPVTDEHAAQEHAND